MKDFAHMTHETNTAAAKDEAKPALVPKLRFPAFREARGWEEKTIGQVCKSFSGGTPNTAQKKFYGGSIPFIRSAEIDRAETELFLTEEGLKNSAAKLAAKGDVLVALYGAKHGLASLFAIRAPPRARAVSMSKTTGAATCPIVAPSSAIVADSTAQSPRRLGPRFVAKP